MTLQSLLAAVITWDPCRLNAAIRRVFVLVSKDILELNVIDAYLDMEMWITIVLSAGAVRLDLRAQNATSNLVNASVKK